MIEKLGEMAEAGRELHRSGELGDDKLKAVYGLRVKFGSGGEAVADRANSATSRSTKN